MPISIQAKHSSRGLRVLITGPASQANVALAEWLGEFEGIDIVGIETRMVKALILADTLKPDVVLLDLETEHAITLNSVHLFREIDPTPAIVVLAQGVTDVIRRRCEEVGTKGYLNKQSAAEELLNTIRKVLAGGKYLTPALAERLVEELGRDPTRPPHELLSNRELQVFKLLVAGRCVKEIAAELSLSVKTISTFRSRILDKLHLRNEVDLAHYAHQHGLFYASRPEDRAPS